MKKRFLLLACLLTLAVAATTPRSATASNADLERKVKAAFLYNFAKFSVWPDRAFAGDDAPFVFCIVGTDPFGESLDAMLSSRQARGRSIVVRRGPDLESLGRCHLLFVGETEDSDVARHLRDASAQPTLTVGESKAFAEAGGMIRLVIDEKRVRFDINEKAASDAGLQLSSQLLKLARQVTR